MADRYIYQVSFEAFFVRAMKGRIDAPTRQRLREAGIPYDEPLPVYPADVFHRGVAIAAEAAHPGTDRGEALYRAGRDHIDAFVESYPGKAMAALARQIEPKMILDYTATFIRLGNNFTESRSRAVGPGRAELWLNDVGEIPDWYRGILQRGLEVANVRDVAVRSAGGAVPPEATFDVTWAAR